MSVQSEIDRIRVNIALAYSAVEKMGGTIPQEANSENLWKAVLSIGAIEGAVYLDGTASDDGDGTLCSPCNNLQSAIDIAGDGGVILMLGPVVFTESATYSANVTIMPAPGVNMDYMFIANVMDNGVEIGVVTLEKMTISGMFDESMVRN